MITKILTILINALFFTILIEVVVAFLLRVKEKKDLINVVLVNVVTNPIVVLFPYVIGMYHGNTYRYIALAILEVLTVIFEGFIYKKHLNYKKINPFLLALILNAASYFIGNIINNIIY